VIVAAALMCMISTRMVMLRFIGLTIDVFMDFMLVVVAVAGHSHLPPNLNI
jgi:hypothetical protein